LKKSSIEAIARVLNTAKVPFIIVGGVAVLHHGYGRMTQDLDLVIRMEHAIIIRAFEALASIGYLPQVPITPTEFADPIQRKRWKTEKHMTVLLLWSDQHPETPIDLFIDEPFDFEAEYAKASTLEAKKSVRVKIVSYATLLEMKLKAGRPRDLADIDELRLLHEEPSSYDRRPNTPSE
jgi:predicted nucleotidyltransferase